MAPKVSVVIDNHNYGRFLREALDSILAQGLREGELEIIVVDDGSTDDSREILASYAPRVKVQLQERQGQATALNNGMEAAAGGIVCLLDSDDVFLPGKLAAVIAAFEDPKVVCVEHYLHDADVRLTPLPRRFPAWPARYALADYAGGRTEFTAISGLAFRRETLRKLLPLPKELFFYVDDYLTGRSLFFGEIANISETFGLHRVHGDNWCAGNLENPVKIERDFQDRALYYSHRDRWFAEAGTALSSDAADAERLELWRRRVLVEALRARPLEAARAWYGGLRGLPRTRQARFRAATTALAVLSPTLYLTLYDWYSRPWPPSI